jgi:hypothetical protein
MKMSVSNYDLLQAKVDAELARYTEELMSHGPQKVVDNAYELVIKSELAVRLESTFLSKQQIRALLDQENPLVYIYERWENDHVAIGDLLCDTIYTAGNDAHRERLTKSKQQRKGKTR